MRLDLLVTSVAALLLLSACGSSVTTGTGGSDGSGGAGTGGPAGTGASGPGSGSNVTATSSGPATGSGTGGSGGAALCQAACAHTQMLGCDGGGDPNCVEGCLSSYKETPQCAPQLDGLAICVANAPSCDLEMSCGPELQAYIQCIEGGMGCGPSECSGGGSSGGQSFCACTGTCNGQEVTSDCTSVGGGDAKCQCFVNGMTVSECTTPASQMCELATTCCADLF